MSERIDKRTTQYFPPNHAQLGTAMKAHDPNHRIRPRRSIVRPYAIAIGIILVAVFVVLLVVVRSVQ